MRHVDKAILHCSDSNIKSHDNIITIREWHLERGFNDVGYHFFIRSNGQIELGRSLEKTGAHCKGQNKNSIGICLHGKNLDDFTHQQFKSLRKLLEVLILIFPELTVHGHNEFSEKECPVFNVTPFKLI